MEDLSLSRLTGVVPSTSRSRRVVVALAAVITLFGAAATTRAQAIGPVSPSFLLALRDVDAAVKEVQKVVTSIKADDLRLSDRDGKFLEGNKARILRWAQVILRQTEVLRRYQHLQYIFELSGALHGLDREVVALTVWLDGLYSHRDRAASSSAYNWLIALGRIDELLTKVTLAFDNEASAIVGRADDALSKPADHR